VSNINTMCIELQIQTCWPLEFLSARKAEAASNHSWLHLHQSCSVIIQTTQHICSSLQNNG